MFFFSSFSVCVIIFRAACVHSLRRPPARLAATRRALVTWYRPGWVQCWLRRYAPFCALPHTRAQRALRQWWHYESARSLCWAQGGGAKQAECDLCVDFGTSGTNFAVTANSLNFHSFLSWTHVEFYALIAIFSEIAEYSKSANPQEKLRKMDYFLMPF